MSISWDVLEGAPIAPNHLIRQAQDYMILLTGHDGWRLHATGQVDGAAWSWSPDAESLDGEPEMTFDLKVTATLGDYSGRVYVNSDQEIEDDGSPVEGRAAIEVLADRTQTSVIAGLALGLAAFAMSGGEFQGVPFSRWYRRSEFEQLFDSLVSKAPDSDSLESAIRRLGRSLGAELLEV